MFPRRQDVFRRGPRLAFSMIGFRLNDNPLTRQKLAKHFNLEQVMFFKVLFTREIAELSNWSAMSLDRHLLPIDYHGELHLYVQIKQPVFPRDSPKITWW